MEKSPCSAAVSVCDNDDLNLRLALPGTEYESEKPSSSSSSSCFNTNNKRPSSQIQTTTAPTHKARVVGWPPVRKTAVQQRRREAEGGGVMVKVSMDGAPYLRKIDLKLYQTYSDLLKALDCMFSCTIGNESCTYQDKDGDWMLVGDVPMEMFITSCKRLRIIKVSNPPNLNKPCKICPKYIRERERERGIVQI